MVKQKNLMKTNLKIKTYVSSNVGWSRISYKSAFLWIKGYFYNTNPKRILVALFEKQNNLSEIKKILNTIDGHYGLIYQNKNIAIISVDKISSIPIYYLHDKNKKIFYVYSNSLNSSKKTELKKINDISTSVFSMSGYTIGSETLLSGVKLLEPGKFIYQKDNKLRIESFFLYEPWNIIIDEKPRLKIELQKIILRNIGNLINSVNNRPIVIPLSGGIDSRLIASVVRFLGYKNVYCFSYGSKNNFESKVSESIAKKLNFKWFFVEHTIANQKNFFTSSLVSDYEQYADNFSSVPYHQDLFSINYLKKKKLIPANSVIVNGNSGDFISGNHLPSAFLQKMDYQKTDSERLEEILNFYIEKHYSLWKDLKSNKSINDIKRKLIDSLKTVNYRFDHPENSHGIYEFLEFRDRQCKYVVNGQRIYEFLGYDWRLPLWNNDFIDFFENIPLRFKLNQNLYRETILDNDWGGVWRKIPINKSVVKPYSINLLRNLLKPLFFFSKKKWGEFDKRYLAYWYHARRVYASKSYQDIIKEKRGFRNPVSFSTERYLNRRGLDHSGKIVAQP